jgi:hypothetical protein
MRDQIQRGQNCAADCNVRDFSKALVAVTVAEVGLYSLAGVVIYAYTGNEYMTAPSFGVLEPHLKKIAFSFMVPTLIVVGVLYASVSARFIFLRIFGNSRHKHDNTVVGWASWGLILRMRTLPLTKRRYVG